MHFLPEHFFLHPKDKDIELKEMYFSIGLRSFAFSLVAIFIPIYLYVLGYGLGGVLLFYMIYFGVGALLTILLGFFTSKHGAKKSIAISYIFAIISFFLLITLEQYSWPLFIIALANAVSANLFWNSYHLDFSKIKKKKNDGKEIGMMIALAKFTGLLAPLIGGALATYYGIFSAFYLASFVLLLAMIPLFMTKEVVKKRNINFKNVNFKKIKGDIFAYSTGNIEPATYYVIWPLIVYLFLKEYIYVGLVTTLASVIVVIFIVYYARSINNENKIRNIKRGSLLNSVQNIYRVFVETSVGIFTANIFANISNAYWQIPLYAKVYEKADVEPRIEYILTLEFFARLSRLIFISILFILTFYLTERNVLVVGLMITVLASLGIRRMK